MTPPPRLPIARATLAAALVGVLAVAASPSPTRADDAADQLRAQYDDAVAQLKAAQDRKNELQADNDRLNGRIKELEAAIAAKDQTTRVTLADSADRTFFLRSHYAAWQSFVADRPDVAAAWRQYLGVAVGADPAPGSPSSRFDLLIDPDWPAAPDAAASPTALPATVPATQPASRPAAPTTAPASEPAS